MKSVYYVISLIIVLFCLHHKLLVTNVIHLRVILKVDSLALEQLHDFHRQTTLEDMGKIDVYITTAKHIKERIVCICFEMYTTE